MPVPLKKTLPDKRTVDESLPRDIVVPDLPDMPDEKVADYVLKQFKAYGKNVDSTRVQAILKNTIDILKGVK